MQDVIFCAFGYIAPLADMAAKEDSGSLNRTNNLVCIDNIDVITIKCSGNIEFSMQMIYNKNNRRKHDP